MEYVPTTDQFVCVVNKKIDAPRLMNAIGHMAAGTVNQHRDSLEELRFRDFVDKDKEMHPSISENGFIVLRAENSNQIRTLRAKLVELGVPFTDFTNVMVEGTFVDQQNLFDVTTELELEYFGVCFFMKKELSRELTKRFSLYQG